MYRSTLAAYLNHHQPPRQRCDESCVRLLTPLTLWICGIFGHSTRYYGNCQMVLGPSTSRLFKTSSFFIKQVQVNDYDKNGVFLYGFSEKPNLSVTENWNVSNYIIVASYSRKGFSLWLNKGSKIQIRWEAQISSLGQLEVSLTKGERNLRTVVPTSERTINGHALREPVAGREADYIIEEDDKYTVGITSSNAKSVMIIMNLNVSSKSYDTSQAETKCSTLDGSCKLNFFFPNTQFIAITTPNHGDLREWYVELSFVARVVTYIAILGLIVVIILIILKYLVASESDTRYQVEPRTVGEVTETDPLVPQKIYKMPYGTGEQDVDCLSSSSSEDLYDGKICVICYEEPRNCFFVPCGHCATCYGCAQRIMDQETRVCPICRRPIHKARKLLIP